MAKVNTPRPSQKTLHENDFAVIERQVESLLVETQSAILRVIDALPGRVNKAIDLQRALELDPKLAWRLFKFANAASVLTQTSMLPGIVPLKGFIAAAERKGVGSKLTRAVLTAYQQFDELVTNQVGDRTAFNAMLNRGNDKDSVSAAHKKAAFRSAVHFMGIQSKCYVISFVLHPSLQHAGQWDLAMITQKIGVHRLRPDALIGLAHVSQTTGSSSSRDPRFEPIASSDNDDARAGLLANFCSNADAETVQTHKKGKYIQMELATTSIGTASATDWVFGVVERNTHVRLDPSQPYVVDANVGTPVESLVIDVLLPKSIPFEPSTRVINFMGFYKGGKPSPDGPSEHSRLAIHETIASLGMGASALRLDGVPRYGEVMTYSCKCLGWELENFRVYRLRVVHPLVGSSFNLTFQC
jgi:hypothetical protein